MAANTPPQIQLLYRVEPGCLGPDGKDHIEGFCAYAQQHINAPEFATYRFVPRYDKSKDEVSYTLRNKRLSLQQAEQFLAHFGSQRSDFEEHLDEQLAEAIDQFLRPS
ncbi:hypothetical protein FIU82_18345 (plasmid) [Pseudoalteromonas sp. THAF3]|uniref:hypothetical protein n=1 Tax=Pseudoalteromonas sp. THAF3 TaxID=2587843 RepID=UPI00126950CF|nr:hypothetical protein [Pseudoalteromonas sp. THAF3]QFU06960.1 hypothetical protein FIU82_18345 [Pseudoalteromonas sp. THAF3]